MGLLIGSGLENKSAGSIAGQADSGLRLLGDLGLTLSVGNDGDELALWGRGSFGGPRLDLSLTGGYRSYFAGAERFKTFLDLDLAAHLIPAFTLGPRVGFGAQLELSQVLGLYGAIGAQIGLGATLRLGIELVIGLQARSYLLE